MPSSPSSPRRGQRSRGNALLRSISAARGAIVSAANARTDSRRSSTSSPSEKSKSNMVVPPVNGRRLILGAPRARLHTNRRVERRRAGRRPLAGARHAGDRKSADRSRLALTFPAGGGNTAWSHLDFGRPHGGLLRPAQLVDQEREELVLRADV